ncbi:PX domain protein (macronuclear) [Tetrahymena thermophila SB210]|uniref:PX domain protein n=1 Tax=Tetrahymena thermophila (strain SB210) TaxID=312017 RepID=I7M3I7_TETTS|nr:PX domain protein [Tetrahymena thermophila SB210]EAS03223.2 PX domain protein [Tetrahymena thermophila SB210]|eukprot:XP_001023468.2 PX domain protein [Tetrahymena thermophila SB210]
MTESTKDIQSFQSKKREAITSDFLKIELTRIFSKVEIEKSKYYAYRMNKFLEIPLDAVYKDPSIIKLTQNKNIINESLNKVPSIIFQSERKVIALNYSFNKNELFIPQKQLVDQEKSIISLKDHHVKIKKITKTETTFIISLENQESVISVKNKLISQGIKAFDEKEKFYFDLIDNVDRQKSIPTIFDKQILKPKNNESFVGYHRGMLQGYLNLAIPPVSPSEQYLNHLQFLSIMNPNYLRMNVVDNQTFPTQSNTQQRKKNNKTETPKISAATPSYRRKRLLSQQQFYQDQTNDQTQNKILSQYTSKNEEVIYEKKKANSISYQLLNAKSPKQVQFNEQNILHKQKRHSSKVTSKQQFEKNEQDQSDQQSNESFDISKRNNGKNRILKNSELFKDNMQNGESITDEKRESVLSEDANSSSTQQIDISETSFTPKITLLQMEINQNQQESESENENEEFDDKEKFHPQTTDSFMPKNYSKLEQIDDLEI